MCSANLADIAWTPQLVYIMSNCSSSEATFHVVQATGVTKFTPEVNLHLKPILYGSLE
jgi:hypothetical protein